MSELKKDEINGEQNVAPVAAETLSEEVKKDIRWYVIHTYSGYENKVLDTLTRKVHSMGMEDTIKQILLPMHDEEEVKDGEKKVTSRKIFPGYLLIQMEVNDHSWYVVRNTPGVTGFVGTTTKPIPLTDEEAQRILNANQKKISVHTDVKVGDKIRITQGAFSDHVATVIEVAADKKSIRADISAFGNTSRIELEAGFFERLS